MMGVRRGFRTGSVALAWMLAAGAVSAQKPAPGATAPESAPESTPPSAPASPAATAQPPAAAPASATPSTAAPLPVPNPPAVMFAQQPWLPGVRAQATHAERGEEPEPPKVHGDAGAPFAIGVGVTTHLHADRSYDLFDDDDLAPAFGLWLAYDVLGLGPSAFVAAEVAWQLEQQDPDDLLGGTLNTDLTRHSFSAGLQVRVVPVSVLQPHLRIAGGASFVAVDLKTAPPQESFGDDGVVPFGSLGVGFTLRTPTRLFETRGGALASLSFGLMIEAGYTLAAPLELTLDGKGPDEHAIPLAESSLGELSSSGPYLRGSGVVRF